MLKFDCKKCGKCCESFGNLGNCLPLFEWEVDELKSIAQKEGLILDIKPFIFWLDKKSGFAFTIQYGLFNEPCPFLKNKSCSIYENRPLICRQFPLLRTPFFQDDRKLNSPYFLRCENFNNKAFLAQLLDTSKDNKMKRSEWEPKYKETYGKCYEFCLQTDFILKSMLIFLEKINGRLKLKTSFEPDFNKYAIIPFFEFLVKINVLNSTQREEYIALFKDKDLLFKTFGVSI